MLTNKVLWYFDNGAMKDNAGGFIIGNECNEYSFSEGKISSDMSLFCGKETYLDSKFLPASERIISKE